MLPRRERIRISRINNQCPPNKKQSGVKEMNTMSKWAAALALVSGPTVANADLVTYEFTGTVTNAIGSYSGVAAGTTVTGTYTFTFDPLNQFPGFGSVMGTIGSSSSWLASITYLGPGTNLFSSTAQVGGGPSYSTGALNFGFGGSEIAGNSGNQVGNLEGSEVNGSGADGSASSVNLVALAGQNAFLSSGLPSISNVSIASSSGIFKVYDITGTIPVSEVDYTLTTLTQVPPLTLACPAATAQAGVPYSSMLTAAGGIPPDTFSNTGNLPPGLNTSTGAVSGTPTTVGTFSFTAQVVDSSGLAGGTVTSKCTITVSPQLSATPTSLSFGTVPRFSLLFNAVTLKNAGTTAVSISRVSITPGAGTDRGDFTAISLCGHSLAPGSSCPIFVVLFASDIGSLSATLNIPNNAAGSPQTVPLSVTVTPLRH
jgi:hypothetical protein